MKFKVGIPLLAILVSFFFAAAFLYIVFNPPFVQGPIITAKDNHLVVVGVGNKGLRDVTLEGVRVNNGEEPLQANVQISNALKGFNVTEAVDESEAEEKGFTDVSGMKVDGGTSPKKILRKLDKGTATEKDIIYGITILHDKPIESVQVKYRYISFPFQKTIVVNNEL